MVGDLPRSWIDVSGDDEFAWLAITYEDEPLKGADSVSYTAHTLLNEKEWLVLRAAIDAHFDWG
jgi:hypothetical protein